MNPDLPYEDDTFVELQKLQAGRAERENAYFSFIIQHKGSATVFKATARDRVELAAKIASGDYEDVDPRNDQSPANLDEDATDE